MNELLLPFFGSRWELARMAHIPKSEVQSYLASIANDVTIERIGDSLLIKEAKPQ